MSCALFFDEFKALVLRAVRWVHTGSNIEIYGDTDLTSLGNQDTPAAYHQAIRTSLGIWGCNPLPTFTVDLVASTVAKKKTSDELAKLAWDHRDVKITDGAEFLTTLLMSDRRTAAEVRPDLPAPQGLDLRLIEIAGRLLDFQTKLIVEAERMLAAREPQAGKKRGAEK